MFEVILMAQEKSGAVYAEYYTSVGFFVIKHLL